MSQLFFAFTPLHTHQLSEIDCLQTENCSPYLKHYLETDALSFTNMGEYVNLGSQMKQHLVTGIFTWHA